jgi:hypothetical protein
VLYSAKSPSFARSWYCSIVTVTIIAIFFLVFFLKPLDLSTECFQQARELNALECS